MFDERANPEVTKGFAERLLVVSLVGGERPQIARVPAGDLLGEGWDVGNITSRDIRLELADAAELSR